MAYTAHRHQNSERISNDFNISTLYV